MNYLHKVRVKVLNPAAKLPEYKTPGAAGMDLRIIEDIGFMLPGEVMKFGTGLAVEVPVGYVGLIVPRSGLGSQGLVLGNLVGTIDSDYQGEIFLTLWNRSDRKIKINAGDRVAQLIIIPHAEVVSWEQVEEFGVKTTRGEGGFGSTGVG